MKAFTKLTSVAAPMPDADLDTDIIFPARFLTLTQKEGLGRYAFHDRRYDESGRERADFVLHREPWRHARILVTGPNFGCGSSREQAPWAIDDLGIRCLIGPGFGDIFEANCHRNGMLPVVVGSADHAALLVHAEAAGEITVDLLSRTVRFSARSSERSSEHVIAFAIDDATRQALLEGLDEIERILRDEGPRIAAFEERQQKTMPWLFAAPALTGKD